MLLRRSILCRLGAPLLLVGLAACATAASTPAAMESTTSTTSSASDTSGEPTASSSSSTSHARPTSTTTAPVRRPARVVLAGDSILYDVTPALQAALAGNTTDVEGLVAPTVSKTVVREAIATALATPTDVLVLMIGVWDRTPTASGVAFDADAWVAEYARETIATVVDAAAARGAHVLFLRPPPMRDQTHQVELRRYGDAWEAYAQTRPADVTVIDTGQWLDSTDAFVEFLPDEAGNLARARRTDGTHLCRVGAVRIAEGLIQVLAARLGADWPHTSPEGWATGPWIERFVAGGQCPAP